MCIIRAGYSGSWLRILAAFLLQALMKSKDRGEMKGERNSEGAQRRKIEGGKNQKKEKKTKGKR